MTTTITKDTIRTNLTSAFDVSFSRGQTFAGPTTATDAQSVGMLSKYAQDATAKNSSGLFSIISQGKQRTSAQPTSSENQAHESPQLGDTDLQTTGLTFLNIDQTSGLDSSKLDVVSVLLARHTSTMFSNITSPKFTTARASTVTTVPVRLNMSLDRFSSISKSAASSVSILPSLKPTRVIPSVFFTVTDTTSASVSQHGFSVKLKSNTTTQTPIPPSSQPVTVLLASSQMTNNTLSFIESATTDDIRVSQQRQPITSLSTNIDVADVDEQSSLGKSTVKQLIKH